MEQPLEIWVGAKVGGKGSQGISRAGQTVLARLMETHIRHLLCGVKAQQRNSGLCQHFCLAESCPSNPFPKAFRAVTPHILELRTSEFK